jgi:AcrR family transcriptional regulator
MGRPKEHGEAMRAALLARAGQLLQEEGAAALSLRRLAGDVGTTTRAVYSVFGGKDGLLSAMYHKMGDTLTRLHDAVPEQEDPTEELRLLCLAYRESVRRHPTLYPLLFGRVPGFSPKAEDEELARRGFVRVLDVLGRGSERGHFQGRTARDMGHELWALVHGLAILELRGKLGKPRRAVRLWEDATSNLIAGFRSAPPASHRSIR